MQSLQRIYCGPDIWEQYANNYYKMIDTSIGSIVVPINMAKADAGNRLSRRCIISNHHCLSFYRMTARMKLITTPRRMIRQKVVQILVAVAEQIRWLSRKTRKFCSEMLYGYYFYQSVPCWSQSRERWTDMLYWAEEIPSTNEMSVWPNKLYSHWLLYNRYVLIGS